jgi:hypothetical protein
MWIIVLTLFQALWNPRSETIEAILQLQNKVSEYSEKGNIITRLLVPSSKVGCILGQGGHVINEMRRRTQADIRVYSKDDKPKCAADDEELVQVMGVGACFFNMFFVICHCYYCFLIVLIFEPCNHPH